MLNRTKNKKQKSGWQKKEELRKKLLLASSRNCHSIKTHFSSISKTKDGRINESSRAITFGNGDILKKQASNSFQSKRLIIVFYLLVRLR